MRRHDRPIFRPQSRWRSVLSLLGVLAAVVLLLLVAVVLLAAILG